MRDLAYPTSLINRLGRTQLQLPTGNRATGRQANGARN